MRICAWRLLSFPLVLPEHWSVPDSSCTQGGTEELLLCGDSRKTRGSPNSVKRNMFNLFGPMFLRLDDGFKDPLSAPIWLKE